jgi:hypothetical protein
MSVFQIAFLLFGSLFIVNGCHNNTVLVYGKLYGTLSDKPIFELVDLNCTPPVFLPLDDDWTIQSHINGTIYTENEFTLSFEVDELSHLFKWSAFQLVTAEGIAYETDSSWNGPTLNLTNQLLEENNLFRPKLCTQQILIVHKPCEDGYKVTSQCMNDSHCIPILDYDFYEEKTIRMHIDFGHIVLAIALFMVLLSSAVFAFRPKRRLDLEMDPDSDTLILKEIPTEPKNEPITFLKKEEEIVPLVFVASNATKVSSSVPQFQVELFSGTLPENEAGQA